MAQSIPKRQEALVLNELHKPEIETIDVVLPGPGQVLIQTKAIALNPTDWKHITGKLGQTGSIVGCDASGVVVAVGEDVADIRVGDNVSIFVHGAFKPIPYPGSFCEYALGFASTTFKYDYELGFSDGDETPVGSILSYEAAASVTLSLATVGYSFYYCLGLDKSKDYSNESMLIWSGSTSVGSIAIQIARWLGFKNVITTSSKANHARLKQFGATHTYDYRDDDVVSQIKKEFGDDIVYALDCFSTTDTFNKTYECLSNTRDSFFDNLLFLTKEDLSSSIVKQTNVQITGTLVYAAMGENATFGDSIVIEATPQLAARFSDFKRDIAGFINGKKLLHIPLKVFPKGLSGVIDGLMVMKEGAYSNQKFVLKVQDTPK